MFEVGSQLVIQLWMIEAVTESKQFFDFVYGGKHITPTLNFPDISYNFTRLLSVCRVFQNIS